MGGWTLCHLSMQDRLRPGRAADVADDQRQQQRAQAVQGDPGGDLAAGESSALGPAGWQVELAVLDQPVGAACVHRQPRLHLKTPGLQLDVEEPAPGGRHVNLPGVAAVAGRGQRARDDLSRASCHHGLAERRTNGPAAVDHLRAGLELLTDRSRRGEVALELGRALWFTDRIADALAVFERALGEVDRDRDADLYELLVAELISSAWWNPRTYPIAEAAIGELDLDALHGGLGSELLLATM